MKNIKKKYWKDVYAGLEWKECPQCHESKTVQHGFFKKGRLCKTCVRSNRESYNATAVEHLTHVGNLVP